jgi:hypothetical protein
MSIVDSFRTRIFLLLRFELSRRRSFDRDPLRRPYVAEPL